MREWSAWYEGTPEALSAFYAPRQRDSVERSERRAGGVLGLLQRMWWGRIPANPSERIDQAHLPVAADIARGSADLLYDEAPQIAVSGSEGTQARIDSYMPDLHQVLANGAELGSVLGGRFHRVTWDKTVADRPFVTTVDADAAYPEFTWGQLTTVTFWYVVAADETRSKVWRHLERHELDADGYGLVFHGLYEGTDSELGQRRPLNVQAATAPLANQVDEFGALKEGRTKGLNVVYVPNQTPQRRWRHHDPGMFLGRSDLDGVEALMDNLDEAFSSWMRDIRIGKGRIIVPDYMLRSNGPGAGTTFDLDRTVYDALNIPDTEGSAPPIIAQQFAIRVEEHLATCEKITQQIVHTAGYSSQTFGDDTDGAAATATEIKARERRTFRTRNRKIRNETPAVRALVGKMLSIDAAVFNTGGLDLTAPISVEFPDTAEDSPLAMAQTAQTLYTARAASTATLVRMQHPDWTGQQVQEEVRLILAEQRSVVDPFTIGS